MIILKVGDEVGAKVALRMPLQRSAVTVMQVAGLAQGQGIGKE
jgi:hypothetical protein